MFHLFGKRRSSAIESDWAGEPVAVALVGLGAMGRTNLEHLRKSPRFRLVGVHDVRPDVTRDVARSFRAEPYESVEDCLADANSEAVFICTPHHLLAPLGLRVVESGKHLLIEKPMAIDVASADRLLESARSSDLAVSVNYSRIFTDVVREARRLFESDAIGDLIGIETRWNGYKRPGYYYGAHSPTPDDWRIDRERAGGGMVIMTTCHALHYVGYVVGQRVTSVSAFTPPAVLSSDVEDTLQGILRLEGGASWALLTSSAQRGVNANDTTIWGTNGTIVMETDRVRFYSTRVIDGRRPGTWHVDKMDTSDVYFDRWLEDTARHVRQAKPLEASPRSGDTLAVIESLYRSASAECVVEVP